MACMHAPVHDCTTMTDAATLHMVPEMQQHVVMHAQVYLDVKLEGKPLGRITSGCNPVSSLACTL